MTFENKGDADGRLHCPGILRPGQMVRSRNGQTELRQQHDGNAVLYDVSGGVERVRWHTGTHGHPNSELVVQHDQVFYVRDIETKRTLFTSNTDQQEDASTHIRVTDDGTLELWNSDHRRYAVPAAPQRQPQWYYICGPHGEIVGIGHS